MGVTVLSLTLLGSPSQASVNPLEEIPNNKNEAYCLAQVIYFEARGEPKLGQIAVAHVTINRRDSKLFPNTICKVVSQKKPCQYSWFCDGKSDRLPSNKHGNNAIALANSILTKRPPDITNGALFFHATSVSPNWKNLEKTIEIGSHVFYRRN